MTESAGIKKIIDEADSGVIKTEEVSAAGLHRGVLRQLSEEGAIYRYSRGIYVKSDAWEDEFYLLQQKYSRGIYSHDTALYLWDYSDRTPAKFIMTFPQGYNTRSLKQENVMVKRVIKENYSLGLTQVKSPCGNLIRVYNLERTLCDIVKGNASDIQVVNAAMKRYAASKEKDINRLMEYAQQLRVKSKVLHYMEVLL